MEFDEINHLFAPGWSPGWIQRERENCKEHTPTAPSMERVCPPPAAMRHASDVIDIHTEFSHAVYPTRTPTDLRASHSHTLAPSHSHTPTLPHSHTPTLSHSHILTLSDTQTLTLSHSHTLTLSHPNSATRGCSECVVRVW